MHLTCPKSHCAETLAPQDAISQLVMSRSIRLGMLTPVDFDHQAPRKAHEIEIVATKRRLSPDMKALLPQTLQPRPELYLRLTHRSPH